MGIDLQRMATDRLLVCWLALALLVRVCPVARASPVLSICSDYEMLIVNTQQCVSRCPLRCNSNGVCYEDGVCPCEGQYQMLHIPALNECRLVCAADCLPGCKSAGGFCAGAALCLCPGKGQRFDPLTRQCVHVHHHNRLRDRCLGRCLYGTCNQNDGTCSCAPGYVMQNTTSLLPVGQLCLPQCNQNCGASGYCYLPNMCACRKKHHHYQADGRCHKDH